MTPRCVPAPLELVFSAERQSVARMRVAVADHLLRAGVTASVVDSVRLALSEAVTNVVLHAYADVPEPGSVHLRAEVRRSMIELTITDDGRGMVPRADSPGAGLGLAIITQIATTVEIGHGPKRGTRLRMSFDRGAECT